ncbi:hypothetical protein Taro_037113 [Colocasia esculenta]|uniref:Uncharacterized protein n=1 Tax=Colocasia esculenta TaxID=4460 RepID=A0A843W8S5_COLES|nr:hypothetical protein [Colocasia esculenta]
MAAAVVAAEEAPGPGKRILPPASAWPPAEPPEKLLSTYIGVSFAVFLGLLPRSAIAYVPCLQARNRVLSLKLLQAEEQLRQMRSRRHEDSKANARVVEIFASHRNAWQQEERRLLAQIDAAADEIAALRKMVGELEAAAAELRAEGERLRREVSERDEVIDFMSRKVEDGCGDGEEEFAEKEVEIGAYGNDAGGDFNRGFEDIHGGIGDYPSEFSTLGKSRGSEGRSPVPEVCFYDRSGSLEEVSSLYSEQSGFSRETLLSASKAWTEKSNGWQDFQYESLGPLYPTKHYVSRRESPWKVDSDSTGVSAKLKLLERELVNLEKLGSGELSKVPSVMRKQAKRYQSLAGKIDDLCRRMQVSDPSEPTLSPEFRTQRQTEFLLEAFRLQHRATETRQKLTALQTETAKSSTGDDHSGQAKLNTRKSLDLIKSNFKEIQRNMEIWLARIMGDLEGILARNGVSHVKDYCISTYPLVG